MHTKNIIHHDIKPENIGVKSMEKEPILKLFDFGTATGNLEPSASGSMIYMDKAKLMKAYPEKFYCHEIDESENDKNVKSADLFAFFVTIS